MKKSSVWFMGLQVTLAGLTVDAARHVALAAGTGARDFRAGTYMSFPDFKDPQARANIIAVLKAASDGSLKPRIAVSTRAQGPELENLKALGADQQVASINYCSDSYRVTTVAGKTTPFWEFNLRFKTDSSDKGPEKGRPVVLPVGMGDDRALVIFSTPGEISSFINEKC